MRLSAIVLPLLAARVLEAGLNACATVGARRTCDPAAGDSVYQRWAPVYRACAVERSATSISQPMPQWIPSSTTPLAVGERCYSADLEFVVDTTGRPLPSSARVIRTNTPDLASAFIAKLPTWQFEPARLAGAKVRQIVDYPARIGTITTVVVVQRGSAPPPPSSLGGPRVAPPMC